MHNLHYYVVEAESGEDACDRVDDAILDWGNENNWRVICGAVSEYNEVHSTGEGRFCPEEGTTIYAIQQEIRESMNPTLSPEVRDTLKKLAEGNIDLKSFEIYRAKEYLEDIYALADIDVKNYNILYDNYKAFEYDQFGVSIGHNILKPELSVDFIKKTDGEIDKESSRLWVVFIDMHS